MHNLKKLLAGLMAMILLFGIFACGKKEEEAKPLPEGQEIAEAPGEAIGAVILVGDDRLVLHYDSNGKVVAIANKDNESCYTELFGKQCAEAAVTILSGTDAVFASKFLLIRQTVGSLEPKENFLQNVYDKVSEIIKDIPVILCSAEDMREQGYFSSDIALAVLDAYLGSPKTVNYSVPDMLDDGYYHITVYRDTTEYYTVGALYGTVAVQLEFPEDELGGSDVDIYEDSFVPVNDMLENSEA